MSSLRIQSLRLCWVEAFMAVAEAESISAAARELGVSQPTITRHLQALESWFGKKLVEPGRVSDPDDPGVSVAITEDGRAFFDWAADWLVELTNFRTVEARCQEELSSMRFMIQKMQADLTGPAPSKSAIRERQLIQTQQAFVASLSEGAPLESLKTFRKMLWRKFSAYEEDVLLEKKKSRLKPRGNIDPSTLSVHP